VNEYTKYFYNVNMIEGHRENDEEIFSRYINSLRYEIRDEISMMTMKTVEYSYQVSLKEEKKLERKKSHRNRGKNPSRGEGTSREKFQKPGEEIGSSDN